MRGEGSDHPGKQHLRQPALYVKKPDDKAHGHGKQNKTHKPVEPRHGVVREEELHGLQPPAARCDRRPFAEEGFYLVGIDELIRKGEHMRGKAENERGYERHGVARRISPELRKRALKRRVKGLFHMRGPFSCSSRRQSPKDA